MEHIDLTEVEREICRLPDVSVARIVADPTGRVTEVHIVAHAGKHPKQIVRANGLLFLDYVWPPHA